MNGTGNDQYISAEAVPTGCTYFIRVDDAIKIGFAGNFKRRFHALQTPHEKPLEVLGVISSAHVGEHETHLRFAHLRIRGEWFRADKELIDFIEYAKAKFGEASPYQKSAKRRPAPALPTMSEELRALRMKHCGNVYVTARVDLLLGQLKAIKNPVNPEHEAGLRRLMMDTTADLRRVLMEAA